MRFDWTKERVDKLNWWWNVKGDSAAMIAARFGCSRSAVIGKAHRMGWSRSGPDRNARPRKRVSRRASPPSSGAERSEAATYRCSAASDRYRDAPDPLPDERIGLLELTATTCRWPLGEPGQDGFGFCGRRCEPAETYCSAHAARAYQPAPRRQRKSSHHRARQITTTR